ncbi:MAG: UDP-glucose/GDP-mannose dehydrogenase family protein [Dissulfurispiraceae bacterium]|jgi:UDPglucose 6-dehydrogenase|nr:UDP-glucose/GDP-mannose dehydrogenase family protein [Dissulfurispiraceae bacterium]
MHIAVIGTGYVGLVTGACFSEFGVFVTCIDKDASKIESLKNGKIPFYEPGLEEIVKRNVEQGRLRFTTDFAEPIDEALVVFIAVGTPPQDDGSADLTYVEAVAREIAQNLKSYKIIVNKSTVPVGTGRLVQKIISENLPEQIDFDVVSNPEFLREGSALEDFMRPNRVVLGADSQHAIAIMKDLYRPLYLIETPFVITNKETAELIKYASNSFLAVKISFINELSRLCENAGADIKVVAKGMGLDRRIGPKFLHAGPGYGGSCFPKDTRALIKIATDHGIDLEIVNAAVSANTKQLGIMIDKIKTTLGELKNKKVAVLGLSFKPNTDDIREAPAIDIIEALRKEGCAVRAYDPVAMDNAKTVLKNVEFCSDAYDACEGSDAVIIVTEWNQFRNLDLGRIKSLLTAPLFFDLRNIYDPQKVKGQGFKYIAVGR